MSQLFHNRFVRIFLGLVVIIGSSAFVAKWWLKSQFDTAQGLVEDQRGAEATPLLRRYLKYQPWDAEARMLLARALISDNSRTVQTVAEETLAVLAPISRSSPDSAAARVIEGRVYLLLLLQPDRAERCFLAALEQDPRRTDAHALLRKIDDITGRWDLSPPHFWRIFEHAPPRDRRLLLRDWYMSEFNPGSANAELDRQLGVLGPDEQPSSVIERRRYEIFMGAEPDAPLGFTCLANWYHQQGMKAQALEAIQKAESLPHGKENPFVIAVHVPISFECGDFDQAQKLFEHWPASDRSYLYWKTKGLICDQILRQNLAAREAYEQALAAPAGQSDWLTRHRLAQVLMRMNLKDEAAAMRNRSKELELQMEPNIHRPLREALSQLEAPETGKLMSQFYERIGRPRESREWQAQAEMPVRPTSPSPSPFFR